MKILISPDKDKNYIIARAIVNRSVLRGETHIFRSTEPATIDVSSGYSLYYLNKDNNLNSYERSAVGLSVDGQAFCKEIDAHKVINLFWIKSDEIKIKVHWGIGKSVNSGTGINGEVNLLIKDLDLFIKSNSCIWECEVRDGIKYEYLSEYYTDNNKHCGISIALRDLVKRIVEDSLPEISGDGLSVEAAIKQKLLQTEIFEEYGLEVDGKDFSIHVHRDNNK